MEKRIGIIQPIVNAEYRLLGRAKLSNGQWANRTDTTAINARIQRFNTTAPTFNGALSPVSTYLLDQLATSDPAWNEDTNDDRNERGYNFQWTIPAASFPSVGWYTVEVKFTDSGGTSTLIWQGQALGSIS
jgi:hypothetical protein